MPQKADPPPNGKKPPEESLHFERSQVKCQRCHRDFEHFMIEEMDGLAQLRCGDVLVTRAEMACLHCGAMFYWEIRAQDLEKMAVTYGRLTGVKGYTPE
jgi:hypothetical protein